MDQAASNVTTAQVSHPAFVLPQFPEVIDSTMRSSLVACHRQFYFSHLLSLRRPGPSIHLHFGGCIATGLEATRKAFYVRGRDEVSAVSEGLKALIKAWGDFEIPDEALNSRSGVKTLEAACDALLSYFEFFPLATDQLKPMVINGEAMIEKSFALPIPGTIHPVTGEPIVYAGRFDMLAQFNDAVFVDDEKTTMALGSTWRSNWPLRGQLTGYCWGGRAYGVNISGVVVRGIAILKQSINFEQCVLTRPAWLVDQWLEQLTRDVNRAVAAWQQMEKAYRTGDDRFHIHWDQAFDSACSSYGGCGFVPLCESQDPRHWYSDYEVRPWNPLERAGDVP